MVRGIEYRYVYNLDYKLERGVYQLIYLDLFRIVDKKRGMHYNALPLKI